MVDDEVEALGTAALTHLLVEPRHEFGPPGDGEQLHDVDHPVVVRGHVASPVVEVTGRGLRGRLAAQPRAGQGHTLFHGEFQPAREAQLLVAGVEFRQLGRALLRAEFAQGPQDAGDVTGLHEGHQSHRADSFFSFRTERAASTCLHGPRPPRYFAHHGQVQLIRSPSSMRTG